MTRLRLTIEAGLRHPLLGPLLLLFLAVVLAFVVIHMVEHGVAGLLFSCAIVAAVGVRLVVLGRPRRGANRKPPLLGRAPPGPPLRLFAGSRLPALALPRRL